MLTKRVGMTCSALTILSTQAQGRLSWHIFRSNWAVLRSFFQHHLRSTKHFLISKWTADLLLLRKVVRNMWRRHSSGEISPGCIRCCWTCSPLEACQSRWATMTGIQWSGPMLTLSRRNSGKYPCDEHDSLHLLCDDLLWTRWSKVHRSTTRMCKLPLTTHQERVKGHHKSQVVFSLPISLQEVLGSRTLHRTATTYHKTWQKRKKRSHAQDQV